jgi:hypothetical protein
MSPMETIISGKSHFIRLLYDWFNEKYPTIILTHGNNLQF